MIRKTNDNVTDRIIADLQRQIDALKKSVNQSMQKDGAFFNGKDGDIRFVRGTDKKGYLEVLTPDGVYTTVTDIFQLMGKERPYPYFTDLLVDNLTAKTFTYKQLVGSNGDYVISDMAEVESVTDTTITFKDLSNFNVCPFVANDLIQALRVNASTNLELRNIKATVSSVSGRTCTVVYTSAETARVGDVFCRVGNTSTAGRQNIIYMSTVDNLNPTKAPFIDLYSGINNFTTYGTVFRSTPKVRIGNLTGITDTDFGGALTGYGLYADNAYLKGKIYLANNGAISLGKTAYNDTTNAGFWIGDSDATATVNPYFYFGTASDTKYIKADLTAGTLATFGVDISAGAIKSTSTMTYDRGVAGTEGGYWLGKYGTNDYRFFIGSSASKYLKYDNTDLTMVGGTITGGTIQTATSGARVVLDADGIRQYVTGKFSAGSSEWYYNTTRYMSMGLEVDLGAVTGAYIDVGLNVLTIIASTISALGTISCQGASINTKFVVDSNGRITTVNNMLASDHTGKALISDGTSFTPTTISGGGITSLNGLTGATQTFANDTNVTIVSSGTTHTITWSGTLADGRIASASTWNAKENALTFQHSLTRSVNTINLVNDSATPGNSKYYGTDAGGTKGFHSLPSGGITSLNSLTGATQTFATGTTGSDFNISSSGTTHTFNIPDASTSTRGAVTTGNQIFAGQKTFNGLTVFNVGFQMNSEVSYSVTGTGSKDANSKNVVILTPDANGYTVTLTNLTNNVPIIVINGSNSNTFTLAAVNSKTIGAGSAVWVMYNATKGGTYIISN